MSTIWTDIEYTRQNPIECDPNITNPVCRGCEHCDNGFCDVWETSIDGICGCAISPNNQDNN